MCPENHLQNVFFDAVGSLQNGSFWCPKITMFSTKNANLLKPTVYYKMASTPHFCHRMEDYSTFTRAILWRKWQGDSQMGRLYV